jgi:hypothetical protein
MLWNGIVFHPFTNSAVEAAFADQRTYVYGGRTSIGRRTWASTWRASFNSPIVAANRGKVVHASPLASTATASSSITAWACSRSTGTSRRSR